MVNIGDLHGDPFSMNANPEKWYISVLILYLIAYVASSLQIVVQFDGSLRPPNDFGVPTSTLGRLAACACTISKSTSVCDNPHLVVTGGKGLVATSTSTSGEVEYEGLLFALKSLRTYLATQESSTIESIASITILGDCKTVIDQMNGKSNSRKLDSYYLRALAEVDTLLCETLRLGPLALEFQHIARTKNVICDRISASIIFKQQKEVFDGVCADILEYEKLSDRSIDISDLLHKWFLHQKSLLPISRRPCLYRYLAEIEIKKKEFHGLLEIGSRYENDVKIVERKMVATKQINSGDTDTISPEMLNSLKSEAISYQIFSLYALGRSREAVRLQTKNRFLLNQCSSTVLEIEKQLKEEGDLPNQETIALLKREMADTDRIHARHHMDWPFPVQEWNDEWIQSRTSWEEQGELLLSCTNFCK